MAYALINDSDGRAVAFAETEAGLTAGTGQTIVEVTTPVAFGYKYDSTSQTWSARDDFFAPGKALVDELTDLVIARRNELSFFCFADQSLAKIRTYIDHLVNCTNAALIPLNQTDTVKIATIRRELELPADDWVCNTTGFSAGTTPSTFYTTVVPDDGGTPWTRGTDSTIAVAPRTYNTRREFISHYTRLG